MNTISGLEFFSYMIGLSVVSAIFIWWLIQKKIITQKIILNLCILIMVCIFSYLIYYIFKYNLANAVSFEFIFFLGPPIILIVILFLSKMNLFKIEKFYGKHIISFFLILVFLINGSVYYNNKKILNIISKYSLIKESFNKKGNLSKSEISQLRNLCELSEKGHCSQVEAIVRDIENPLYYKEYINRNLDELIKSSKNKIQNYIIFKNHIRNF